MTCKIEIHIGETIQEVQKRWAQILVENSLTSLSEPQLRTVDLQGQVDAFIKAKKFSQQAYNAGSISLTDVLDAERELLIARDSLEANRAAAAQAAVLTFRSLGGGWKISDQLLSSN